ncbi:spx domain protein [Diplodia corticola]|uniref:Spx domain protein n=1 Tax=Diplodia corticola TaxID=236234 RepID=A0A1J9QT30_9PEZI|nr:spx domain protein [Diplodia corticola]OJD31561.1 spx domain protein [Diplodia corticola]
MRFGRTLQRSVYPPWNDQYIDYDKLKQLLREGGSDQGSDEDLDDTWTEEDEGNFVEELVNVQLEKVHDFQNQKYQDLRDRTSECERKLEPLTPPAGQQQDEGSDANGANGAEGSSGDDNANNKKPDVPEEERKRLLQEVLKELDTITKEVSELERYSRINYTGFLKAAKKHDRKRGHSYRVRPLLQVRLAALPFNKEDYSPLLIRLSAMYSFVRQNLEGKEKKEMSFSEGTTGGEHFTSHKFWVHPENLLEVKTVILRRLPVLVYNPQTSKIAEGNQHDPSITSIYFDNRKFSLYTDKVGHEPNASSLRLRWYGQLEEKPEIVLEKKTIKDGDASEELRFPIKEKYIEQFIRGEYKMEKSIDKLKRTVGGDSPKVQELRKSVDAIQSFVREKDLQPLLRANYTRTAFQIPGDNRVRISLDTNLALIREDAIDRDRPCRDPDDWHRSDIDSSSMEYPFNEVRKGEISRFPFALLEIKIKGEKHYEWVEDLMNSHLVKEAPRFSKFVHGVAQLFEDHVNTFPFWLSELETDIRRDPHKAFEEEQERKAKAAEDEVAVGSLFGTRGSPLAFRASLASPVGSPSNPSMAKLSKSPKATIADTRRASLAAQTASATHAAPHSGMDNVAEAADSDSDGGGGSGAVGSPGERNMTTPVGVRSLFPSFSYSKYAQRHRARQQQAASLPPGVRDPGPRWIKDQGPVRVEAKVWLANQRTFIKWQHVSVLLASLSLGLFNAAGETNTVARALAVAYTAVAAFAGVWGYAMYMHRSRLIRERSGKDFDNPWGPMVVCLGLVIALCCNFGFRYRAITQEKQRSVHDGIGSGANATVVEAAVEAVAGMLGAGEL